MRLVSDNLTCNSGISFKSWLRQVDFNLYMISTFVTHHNDIEDWHYYDDYQNGVRPRDSAKAALINAGWEG